MFYIKNNTIYTNVDIDNNNIFNRNFLTALTKYNKIVFNIGFNKKINSLPNTINSIHLKCENENKLCYIPNSVTNITVTTNQLCKSHIIPNSVKYFKTSIKFVSNIYKLPKYVYNVHCYDYRLSTVYVNTQINIYFDEILKKIYLKFSEFSKNRNKNKNKNEEKYALVFSKQNKELFSKCFVNAQINNCVILSNKIR